MAKYHVFHQNMRVFGGGSYSRNEAFEGAMEEISSDLGNSRRVLVAGYTEVMNGKTASALTDISVSLDPALTKPLLFAVGITAFKASNPEFVAISLFKTFKLIDMGRVLRLGSIYKAPRWVCISSGDLDITAMPDEAVPDSRGMAYVYGSFQGQSIVVGFMHNLYNLGDRSGSFQAIGGMTNLIRKRHGLGSDVPIIFGGDFNVKPRDNIGGVNAAYAEDDNKPVNTTSHHAYDFWITTTVIDNDRAFVHAETRNVSEGLSDHAGISLELPWFK